MSTLKLDLVFILANPVISDPLEYFRLKVLESLIKHILIHNEVNNFEIYFLRLRFLSNNQLKDVFDTLERVCKQVGISLSDLKLKFGMSYLINYKSFIEDEDLVKTNKTEELKPKLFPTYKPKPKSEFELEMCNIFIPLLKYKKLFDLYGLEGCINLLIYGHNSGNVFIEWYKSIQEHMNKDKDGNECSRTLQLSLIRFSEILMPYFGESEQKLKFLFELAVQTAKDGVMCICLEGLHNFSNSKDTSDDLERRILSTLLLLLDGINKNKPVSDVSIVVVATTEDDPEFLDEALLRPGRLDRILELESVN